MASFGERLKQLREKEGLTQPELAKLVGVGATAIANYEAGSRNPKFEIEEAIADFFNVSLDYLRGKSDKSAPINIFVEADSLIKAIRIPVLGDVAAGIPIEAVEDIIDYEEIPAELAEQGQFFGLRIKGDSMEPRICEGDVVIVKKQEDADTGDIVIACVNGDSATCKRLIKYPDQIVLMPLNNKYDPLIFTMEDIKNTPLTIIGKVVELRGKL